MKVQYMSDLHMELWDNSRFIKANEFEVVGDVLVLAGDTFYLRDIIAPQKRFWKWASESFRQVLLVPGNHEFYSNSDVTSRGDSWQWLVMDEPSGKAERREHVFTIDKKYELELASKIDAFRQSKQHTKTHSVQLVMVTPNGRQRFFVISTKCNAWRDPSTSSG